MIGLTSWWQAVRLPMSVALSLRALNRYDLMGNATAPTILRHKIDLQNRTPIMLKILLGGWKGYDGSIPWTNTFTTSFTKRMNIHTYVNKNFLSQFFFPKIPNHSSSHLHWKMFVIQGQTQSLKCLSVGKIFMIDHIGLKARDTRIYLLITYGRKQLFTQSFL